MGMTRFSINAILWFGDEMRKFDGVVPGDDEEFMSCIYPTKHGMSNAWNGDAIVAHFAFFTQREQLDKWHILERYGEVCCKNFANSDKMRGYYDAVQDAMTYVRLNEAELTQRKSPYRSVPAKITWRGRIKEYLPEAVRELLLIRYDLKRQGGFIVE